MDLACLAFSSLVRHLTLSRTPYSRRLLGALVTVFLISYQLGRYKTSYIAISIYYFLVAFDLKGRLWLVISFYRLCGRLAVILITRTLLTIIPPKRLAVLF